MGSAIGLRNMWTKTARTLFLANLVTFILVLATLCACVFSFVAESIYAKERNSLNTLADSVISSIDFDDHGRGDSGKPDLISSAMPDESAKALLPLRLEWFDRTGKLSAQKGTLKITLNFDKEAGFQTQTNPHALVLTKTAYSGGQLLGYVRVAEPLTAADAELQRLAAGMTFGAIASLCLSGICITWLLKLSLAPLEQSIQRLKQFTADASHEFRNPLMAIKSNCSAALRNDSGMREEDRRKFSAVTGIADDLNELVEDLLELARTEHVQASNMPSGCVDLVEVLKKMTDRQWQISGEKRIQLQFNLPETLEVRGNESDFQRLFGNIIENAFEYTHSDGLVEISGVRHNHTAVVTIQDNGIGIAPEDKHKIFDRFWRADKARSYRTGGSGLGLSIAKAIAAKYKGDIAIESAPGAGTACRVTLNC